CQPLELKSVTRPVRVLGPGFIPNASRPWASLEGSVESRKRKTGAEGGGVRALRRTRGVRGASPGGRRARRASWEAQGAAMQPRDVARCRWSRCQLAAEIDPTAPGFSNAGDRPQRVILAAREDIDPVRRAGQKRDIAGQFAAKIAPLTPHRTVELAMDERAR